MLSLDWLVSRVTHSDWAEQVYDQYLQLTAPNGKSQIHISHSQIYWSFASERSCSLIYSDYDGSRPPDPVAVTHLGVSFCSIRYCFVRCGKIAETAGVWVQSLFVNLIGFCVWLYVWLIDLVYVQIFYESFDEPFEGRWIVSEKEEFTGKLFRVCFGQI